MTETVPLLATDVACATTYEMPSAETAGLPIIRTLVRPSQAGAKIAPMLVLIPPVKIKRLRNVGSSVTTRRSTGALIGATSSRMATF